MSALCVSVKEAAATLGVSQWVVRRYIATGLLAAVKFPSTAHPREHNRRVLIAAADLQAFVAAHRQVAK